MTSTNGRGDWDSSRTRQQAAAEAEKKPRHGGLMVPNRFRWLYAASISAIATGATWALNGAPLADITGYAAGWAAATMAIRTLLWAMPKQS